MSIQMEDSSYLEYIEGCMSHFERNKQLDNLRSGLHVKAMKIMQELMGLEKNDPPCATSLEQRGMLQLLNYLIVDYFNWFGYMNTLQTFAIETGEKSKPKPREKLQQELNMKFENADLPILLIMLLKESTRNNDKLMNKNLWEHMPLKTKISPKKLKKTKAQSPLEKDTPPKAKLVKKVKITATAVVEDDVPAEGKPSKIKEKIEQGAEENNIPSKMEKQIDPSVMEEDIPANETPNKVKNSKKFTSLKDTSVNKRKNSSKASAIVKDIPAPHKTPSKVMIPPKPSIMVTDMPVKETPVKARYVRRPSAVANDIPAKKRPISIDVLIDSNTRQTYISNKEQPKKIETLHDKHGIKVPLSKVNVRQSMANSDTQRQHCRTH